MNTKGTASQKSNKLKSTSLSNTPKKKQKRKHEDDEEEEEDDDSEESSKIKKSKNKKEEKIKEKGKGEQNNNNNNISKEKDKWTKEQLVALELAKLSVREGRVSYWHDIAKLVPGKTAAQCHEKYNSKFYGDNNKNKNIKNNKNKKIKKEKEKGMLDSALLFNVKVGTAKHKRKLREMFEKLDAQKMKMIFLILLQ